MELPQDVVPLIAQARRADQPRLLGDGGPAPSISFDGGIGALLARRAKERADCEYLTFVDNERGDEPAAVSRLSFAKTAERVARLMGVLDDLGLRAGDTISTVDRFNHADTVCLLLAAWCSGLRVAPLNVEEDDVRLAFILENAGAKAAFVRAAHLEQIERVNRAAEVPILVTMGAPKGAHPFASLERLEKKASPRDLVQPGVGLHSDALLVYTSGTTGHPKGVCLAHALLHDVAAVNDFHGLGESDVYVTAMRLFHVNAIITSMMAALLSGGRLVLLRRWDPAGFWGVVRDERATTTSVVPAMLADLLRVGGKPDASVFGHFKTLICGAGTLKKSLARQWLDTHPLRIAHGWGMSETTCWGCWLPRDLHDNEYRELMLDYEAPSIGAPHRWNRMHIFDAKGNPCEPGEKGQIVLAGPNVMEGYFQRDDANRDAFKFGVLETGDEGFHKLDAKGRPMFFITGRLKDIIERGGEKFSPYEMDDDFTAMAGVRSALVFGFPHERLGQEIGVVLECEEGFEITLEQAWRFAEERGYSWAKAPKELRLAPIPKTSTGKETRKLFAAMFEGCEKKHYKRPEWWK